MYYLKIFLAAVLVLVKAIAATACLAMAIINYAHFVAWICLAIVLIAAAITFLCWASDNF